MEYKRRKIVKGKVENGKQTGNKCDNGQRTFFSICLFIYLFIFAFHFLEQLKFVLGLPKWKFSTGIKSGKVTLPPLKNIPLMPLVVRGNMLSAPPPLFFRLHLAGANFEIVEYMKGVTFKCDLSYQKVP